jgi:hypothetical protein
MNLETRSAQIWSLLTYAASLRATLTYKRLGELIGAPPAALGAWLEPIQSYCLVHQPEELPPLTALVVREGDGMPGGGFTGASNVPRAQADVFGFDWRRVRPPTPEELLAAVVARPSNGIRDSESTSAADDHE